MQARKLVSYFLNNAAKTRSYGLKISENTEIKHLFPPKSFFYLSNFHHTSYFSALKWRVRISYFLDLIVGVNLYLIMGKKFSQSNLLIV